MINNSTSRSGSPIQGSGLLLAVLLAACTDTSNSLGAAGDAVSNGSFGVTDGSPFHVTGAEGGPFPEGSRTYTLENYTMGVLRWDLETSVPWLTSDSLGGVLSPGTQSEVTLTLDQEFAATLSPGDYPADIVFTDRDHPSGILAMSFLLTVEPGPSGAIAVSPDETWSVESLAASGVDGLTRTYTISNAGEGDLEWSASSNQSWLLVSSPSSGILAPGDSTEVIAELASSGLPGFDGIHYGSVDFANLGDPTDVFEALVSVRIGDGSSERVTQGLVGLYDFEEAAGSIVHDQADSLEGMDLVIETPSLVSWGPGTLTTQPGARISTAGAATALTNALRSSGAVTFEAWIAPENLTQDGPARIMSLSGGAYSRNLTLGQGLWGDQASDSFNVRLRTTETDVDGMPMLNTGAGGAVQGLQHVVYTRAANGSTRIFVNGVARATGSTPGTLANWSDSFRFILGNEEGAERSWQGRYHLLGIYDRALSMGEVTQNFEAGTGDASGPLLVTTPGTAFTASGMVGSAISPGSMTYTLSNGGSAPLSWEASIDGVLAIIDGPTAGTLQPDETASLLVRIDQDLIAGLSAGLYEGSLEIIETTQNAGSTSRAITVQLEDSSNTGGSGGSTGGGNSSTDYGEKPGSTNTGPSAPGLLVPSNSITVTQDGAVIENVNVSGMITIAANNVTIRNFRIDGGMGVYYGIKINPGTVGTLIEDGEIHHVTSCGVIGSDFIARRLNVHHSGADGFKTTANVLIEHCWIHHCGMNPAAHADGNQTRQGGNIMLRANNFDMPSPAVVAGMDGFLSNACSINQAKAGPINNLVMEGNWINGGSYSVYFTSIGYPLTNCALVNNLFGRDSAYGPLMVTGPVGPIEISGNRWEDTGELMSINN